MLYDAFICHASEDKDDLVRPLAERLRSQHVAVWYDEFSLSVGDSLRRSIDRGLSQSRFGIVVLSPNFFRKNWSQWELDGFVARQNSGSTRVILPVWHNVQQSDVLDYSPPLADMRAVTSDVGVEAMVRQLVAVIHPRGSTLVIARDHLLEQGCDPPVISDDWWLDVAAAAESNELEGDFQEPMGWGRWGFPLPESSNDPEQRGLRLAWAAMQMTWQQEAAGRPITQITRPEIVHEFINAQPGLAEACRDNVRYLIAYAPQLVIPGFGDRYEGQIETLYRASVAHAERQRATGDRTGSAQTWDSRHPGCDDEYALRDPEFGRYSASHAACGFVQGNYVANGPPVMYYAHFDYLAWLMSDASLWLPTNIRTVLTRGMAEWGVWPWYSREWNYNEEFGFVDAPFTGALAEELDEVRADLEFQPTPAAYQDLLHRLQFSVQLLGLPEDEETLAQRVLDPSFLRSFFARKITRSDAGDGT